MDIPLHYHPISQRPSTAKFLKSHLCQLSQMALFLLSLKFTLITLLPQYSTRLLSGSPMRSMLLKSPFSCLPLLDLSAKSEPTSLKPIVGHNTLINSFIPISPIASFLVYFACSHLLNDQMSKCPRAQSLDPYSFLSVFYSLVISSFPMTFTLYPHL